VLPSQRRRHSRETNQIPTTPQSISASVRLREPPITPSTTCVLVAEPSIASNRRALCLSFVKRGAKIAMDCAKEIARMNVCSPLPLVQLTNWWWAPKLRAPSFRLPQNSTTRFRQVIESPLGSGECDGQHQGKLSSEGFFSLLIPWNTAVKLAGIPNHPSFRVVPSFIPSKGCCSHHFPNNGERRLPMTVQEKWLM